MHVRKKFFLIALIPFILSLLSLIYYFNQKREILGKEKGIRLNQILYLNEFYRKFDSLKFNKRDITLQKYIIDLHHIEVIRGRKDNKTGCLQIKGKKIVIAIKDFHRLMKARKLNLIEMELLCNRDIEISTFVVPRVGAPQKELAKNIKFKIEKEQWLGDFIYKTYLPKTQKQRFQRVTINLTQRFFSWGKTDFERVAIKMNSPDNRRVKVKLKNLSMLDQRTRLIEEIPGSGYFRFEEGDRRRLQSVFLPTGSQITYTINTIFNDPVTMDGYLGSIDGKKVILKITANNKQVLYKKNSDVISFFKIGFVPEKRRFKLEIRIMGEANRLAVLGNVSLSHHVEKKRNVVYYLIDALRADYCGIEKKLFINSFKNGAIFTNAFSNATRTADSLPSLFSGKYKFTLVEKDIHDPFVINKELLIAEYFKSKGYTTAAFISNPMLYITNSSQGFDHINFCWNPGKAASVFPTEEDYKNKKYGNMKKYLLEFVEENEHKPLFIFIHTMEPHVPYEPPENRRHYSSNANREILDTLFKNFTQSPEYPSLKNPNIEQLNVLKALYKDQVLIAHNFFEEVRSFLESKNILNESSLFILTSDHGERFYEHKSWIHGPPDVYNEVLRIPLMMKGDRIKPGIYKTYVQLVDIYPTIVDWFESKIPKDLVGNSLIEYMNQSNDFFNERTIYIDGIGTKPHYAFIKNNIKVIINGDKVEAYKLEKNSKETLSLQNEEQLKRLITDAKTFRTKFKRSFRKKRRGISAEEYKRLKTLGYIH
jgi:arylsulfatase A-like enzyme